MSGVRVRWCSEDGCYIASSEAPVLVCHAATRDEAIQELWAALQLYTQIQREMLALMAPHEATMCRLAGEE